MVKNVSVDEKAIAGGKECCKISIELQNFTIKHLKEQYQRAGSNGWNDSKYKALGELIMECCNSMASSVKELEDCVNKLDKLARAIDKYESVNI